METSSEQLGMQIGSRLYLAQRYARAATNRALDTHQVQLRHLGVLIELAASGPLSQRELIDRLQVDKSSMVHIIDELERQSLAERRRNERDRRSYAVHLTAAGEERLAASQDSAAAVMNRLLAPLSDTEQQQLHDLLVRFIDSAAQSH